MLCLQTLPLQCVLFSQPLKHSHPSVSHAWQQRISPQRSVSYSVLDRQSCVEETDAFRNDEVEKIQQPMWEMEYIYILLERTAGAVATRVTRFYSRRRILLSPSLWTDLNRFLVETVQEEDGDTKSLCALTCKFPMGGLRDY